MGERFNKMKNYWVILLALLSIPGGAVAQDLAAGTEAVCRSLLRLPWIGWRRRRAWPEHRGSWQARSWPRRT